MRMTGTTGCTRRALLEKENRVSWEASLASIGCRVRSQSWRQAGVFLSRAEAAVCTSLWVFHFKGKPRNPCEDMSHWPIEVTNSCRQRRIVWGQLSEVKVLACQRGVQTSFHSPSLLLRDWSFCHCQGSVVAQSSIKRCCDMKLLPGIRVPQCPNNKPLARAFSAFLIWRVHFCSADKETCQKFWWPGYTSKGYTCSMCFCSFIHNDLIIFLVWPFGGLFWAISSYAQNLFLALSLRSLLIPEHFSSCIISLVSKQQTLDIY